MAYVNMSKLEKNKAYRMEGLVETNHATYGKGQQATIKSSGGTMFRTQLPGKYLANLKPEMIDFIKKDIVEGRNPYLIYREQMKDNSYRIDILEKCKCCYLIMVRTTCCVDTHFFSFLFARR